MSRLELKEDTLGLRYLIAHTDLDSLSPCSDVDRAVLVHGPGYFKHYGDLAVYWQTRKGLKFYANLSELFPSLRS